MRFDIITIFPEIFKSYFKESIIKRALKAKLITVKIHNLRDYSTDKHKKVDDIPFGGGAGMVMTPQPLYDCIQSIKKLNSGPVIYLSPQGQKFTQTKAERFAKQKSLILLCGRYEGIDQRIIDLLVDQQISVGDYVLTGGELPSMILLDAIARLVPGVLGKDSSHEQDSFSKAFDRKKEYPHYTRPKNFKGLEVPEILLSGHHAKIETWRKKNLK